MSAVQALYAETVTDVTASGTGTWVDCASISAGSFNASVKYLILAMADLATDNSTAENHVRLVHGSTPTEFTDADAVHDSGSGADGGMVYSWMYVFTQPGTTEEIKLQIQGESTTTATCKFSQIVAINLDNFGIENTDYYYNEVTADYSTTTTPTAQASITFTASGTDVWLVIGHASIMETATVTDGNAAGFELHESVGGTVNPKTLMEGEDANAGDENRAHCGMRVFTPSAASHTFSVRPYHIGTASFSVGSTRIFAMKLNKFAQYAHAYTDGGATPAASPSWTNVATLNFTPTLTGNWFYWSQAIIDIGSLGDEVNFRLQDDNDGSMGSDPNYGDDAPNAEGWDSADFVPSGMMKMKSLSFGISTTVNFDATHVVGTTSSVAQRSIVAFSLELASSATPSIAFDSRRLIQPLIVR